MKKTLVCRSIVLLISVMVLVVLPVSAAVYESSVGAFKVTVAAEAALGSQAIYVHGRTPAFSGGLSYTYLGIQGDTILLRAHYEGGLAVPEVILFLYVPKTAKEITLAIPPAGDVKLYAKVTIPVLGVDDQLRLRLGAPHSLEVPK